MTLQTKRDERKRVKTTWSISSDHSDCPRCHSILVSVDGRRLVCPACSVIEIDRLSGLLADVEAQLAEARDKLAEWKARAVKAEVDAVQNAADYGALRASAARR